MIAQRNHRREADEAVRLWLLGESPGVPGPFGRQPTSDASVIIDHYDDAGEARLMAGAYREMLRRHRLTGRYGVAVERFGRLGWFVKVGPYEPHEAPARRRKTA